MTVPEFTFLTVDGGGDPNTSLRYAAGLSVLYVAAYTLKVAVREALGIDYRVLPLEGPWVSRHPVDFTGGDKRDRLRLMVFEEGAARRSCTAAVRDRGTHHRTAAAVHRGERPASPRQAPRDLPQRPGSHQAGEDAHGDSPALNLPEPIWPRSFTPLLH